MRFDWIFYLVRLTPFWAVPGLMVFGYFFYIFWLKGIREVSFMFLGLAGICFSFLVFFLVAGGPEQAAKLMLGFLRNFFGLYE